eukprot:CAMPEP_0119266598 /NCGR_PEP_ID=MMETSP1329-20130426/5039_1 /TAXON_ID=114041 /ORGANISM="Genus nov. species nov., Strain RCC1024" /LENGTH=150 /DNA_ID=CAMNT_0007266487 /DNA_START=157 /DNA_END=607 /DNA_ORIENTATION=+
MAAPRRAPRRGSRPAADVARRHRAPGQVQRLEPREARLRQRAGAVARERAAAAQRQVAQRVPGRPEVPDVLVAHAREAQVDLRQSTRRQALERQRRAQAAPKGDVTASGKTRCQSHAWKAADSGLPRRAARPYLRSWASSHDERGFPQRR